MKTKNQKSEQKRAGIVGAGIGGLATAIRLAVKGYSVDVYEGNPYPGGKLSEIKHNGYRFDAGPSLFTLPALVDELFEVAGKNPADYFTYQKLPETCRYFYEDGTRFTADSTPERLAKTIEKHLGEPAAHVLAHLQDSAKKYDVTEKLFLHRSLHRLATYFNKDALKGYLNLHKLDAFQTMNRANATRFQDPRVVQLFNRYATYNGSDPYQTPATMNIIPHLEYNIGAFFPKGGMVSITNSLVTLAEELGVRIHLNSPVEKILTQAGQISGIQVAGNSIPFDVVVSNMDVVNTFRKLLPEAKQPERILRQPKSSSALIFYWGIKKEFPELGLHNIFFSQDYAAEFATLFKQKTIHDDPTVYINITSKYEKADAPDGGENWFVMVNAPANDGQNWEELIATTRKNILEKLSRHLGENIEALLETEDLLDPRLIESRTSSSQGALYGNSSNNRFAAFLRHANFSSQFPNLFFVGGSVHPGGGVPLCLLSAKIATDMIPA
ncbi:1-hydroxycarotenoid 3,4-desaturase CrtD [Arundinibacter roseus]|uniref:Phytoene desaturase n=1 Tax=Arundinibacter roseus TaxID=2070510 RepID=A0A4R4KIN7_9BACT|nr:1-hydroxycarotenoid 3,4-desaturase CrtD [Arundinibacter roseus]TDB68084.1 phytoene desaturase [Arundinibacter roseus]